MSSGGRRPRLLLDALLVVWALATVVAFGATHVALYRRALEAILR